MGSYFNRSSASMVAEIVLPGEAQAQLRYMHMMHGEQRPLLTTFILMTSMQIFQDKKNGQLHGDYGWPNHVDAFVGFPRCEGQTETQIEVYGIPAADVVIDSGRPVQRSTGVFPIEKQYLPSGMLDGTADTVEYTARSAVRVFEQRITVEHSTGLLAILTTADPYISGVEHG